MVPLFDTRYPTIAAFVTTIGWVELGHDDNSRLTSFIRALDPGGIVWEGNDDYTTVDEVLHDLENGLRLWMHEQGIMPAE